MVVRRIRVHARLQIGFPTKKISTAFPVKHILVDGRLIDGADMMQLNSRHR